MKLTLILLTAAFFSSTANGLSQSITFSGRNASLEEIISVVEEQAKFVFIYDKAILKNARKINISVSGMSVPDFLHIALGNQSFSWTIQNHTVVLKKNFADNNNLLQDTRLIKITGTVTGPGNIRLAGATIQVKGRDIQTISDDQGRFELNAEPGATLVISYIGFEKQEYKLLNNDPVTISMRPLNNSMDTTEIVVNTGYQLISKERATGAYSILTSKELQEVPTIDLLERIEGKTPGVKVDVKNGKIQIRTVNTFTTNTAPLIVIDGFPMIPTGDAQNLTTRGNPVMANGSVLSAFNANDIEQITFLKDAVATSVWGARGANGVIVIETKKGKKGAPTVALSATLGSSKAPSISDLDWMSTADYVNLELEMLNKGFLVDATTQSGYNNNKLQTPNPSEVQEWYYKVKRGQATQAQADAAIAEIAARSNYGQIEKYLLRTALNQQYNLSVSGGGEGNAYYISGNLNRDLPIFRGNSAQNVFLTGNFTNDLFNKWVKMRTGFAYQSTTTWAGQAATDALSQFNISLRPYDMLVDANGNPIRRSITLRPELNDSLVAKGFLPSTYNAIDELNNSRTKASGQQIRLSMGFNVKLTSWMNFDLSGMYQRNTNTSRSIDEVLSYANRTRVNTYTTTNTTTGKPIYNLPYGGRYQLSDVSAYDYNVRGVLNINHNFTRDHQLAAIAGGEIRESYNTSSSTTRYGYDPDANSFATINPTVSLPTMFGYSQSIGDNTGGILQQKNRYLSYFGNAGYTYKGRYNLSASARFDDYTLLGIERSKRARPFWSAGAKWSLGQEAFMAKAVWINALDLRLTYGTGGSVPQAGNNVPLISLNTTDPSTQLPTATISTPANQQLGWETTKTLNLGMDLRLFNNRLSINIDAYQKRSDGIITSLPINPAYGWSSLTFNTGVMKSHGLEAGITGRLLNQKNWAITSTFNIGYGKTQVTDNRYEITQAATLVNGSSPVNGQPVGATFVYRSAGLNNQGQMQIYDRSDKIIGPGTNLTSAFDKNDLKYVGIKTAPYSGGFFNNIRYKNLSMNVQMTYYMGHIFMKPAINNYPSFAGTYSGNLGRQKDLARRWRQPGDEQFTDIPGLSNISSNSITRYRLSDKLVRKADNIRLQQLSLNYSFAQQQLPKGVIKGLSVSATARNLGIIWRANKDGIDPEYLNSNSNYYGMPPVTSYVFSINATF